MADHERIWAGRQALTDPAHLAAAVEQRDLTDYDTALGLDDGTVA